MNENTKNQIKQGVNTMAQNGAAKAVTEAKQATGWKKWAWAALAAALGAIAYFTLPSCTPVQREQVQRVEAVHDLYHEATGKPCIFKTGTK